MRIVLSSSSSSLSHQLAAIQEASITEDCMLLHPRQPDTLQATTSTRPLSRSSSSTTSTGLSRPALPRSASSTRPLQSIQPSQAMRDPTAPPQQINDKINRPSTSNPPTRSSSAQPPQAQTAEPVKEEKKKDRSKLTEQWGPPPDQIRRDNEWLQRGQLLGEVNLSLLSLLHWTRVILRRFEM